MDRTSAVGPSSSRAAARASWTDVPRNRFRCMGSVENGDWTHPDVGWHLVVREHPDLRQHPREQPPQVRAQARRTQKHGLCHCRFDCPGDARRQSLGLGWVDARARSRGPSEPPTPSNRSSSAGAKLMAGSSPLSDWCTRQIARPRAARTASTIRSGSFVVGRRVGDRFEDGRQVPHRHAFTQELAEDPLDVADASRPSAPALPRAWVTSERHGRPCPWSAGGRGGPAGTHG